MPPLPPEDTPVPAAPRPPARFLTKLLRPGPFLFIGIVFIALGLTALSYTAVPAFENLVAAFSGGVDHPDGLNTEANWSMFMGMAFGLVAFVGGVLVMGGSFLIRTHVRDYDNLS
ncbi:MAG: hypothetical protein PHI64_03610 [Zoogloea sp.]|uniref:hypothetical protein n=1 Tax=Zoogloea sp. TaxID=49181 RepID=UPI002606C16D|nr:hypothetical protein [Zoogloea sp.]MDD2988026.1 hypothetical protein [Zoogloea sp.]